MKQRCYNPKFKQFSDYGGRGITVCDRGKNSFENFYADMGTKPIGTSLDRINNEEGYSPENCRWATRFEQECNKRKPINGSNKYKNVYRGKTPNSWRVAIVRQKTYYNLGTFTDQEAAVRARDEFLRLIKGNIWQR